ncbi:MAG TPA: hypothetical protein VJZ26_04640 [Blastocatellia bacterium]|nr:hypothetical protein [Blastocatellia bacterium]
MSNHDVFISYAHLDNLPSGEGKKGWVESFDTALNKFLGEFLGAEPKIWRDPNLSPNGVITSVVIGNLMKSLTLVSILSPRYIGSEWCSRELLSFCENINIQVGDRLRVFKVVKTPIEREEVPPVIRETVGFDFFELEARSKRPRQYAIEFGDEWERKFYLKVSDLAYEIAVMLKELKTHQASEAPSALPPAPHKADKGAAIYLAEPSPDLWDEYHNIRRDLLQRQFTVLPSLDTPKPTRAEAYKAAVREDLLRCKLSVHLIGKEYGRSPEDDFHSYVHLQTSVAAERDGDGSFTRLVWLPKDVKTDDVLHRGLVNQLLNPTSGGVDVLQTSLEDLKTRIQDVLQGKTAPSTQTARATSRQYVYVLYDKSDVESAKELENYLYEQGCEVMPASDFLSPAGEGNGVNVIEAHKQYLQDCDAVMIYCHSAPVFWVRTKLRDLQRIKGDGRAQPFRAAGVFLAGDLIDKNSFRTSEAILIKGLDDNNLNLFLAQLTSDAEGKINEG